MPNIIITAAKEAHPKYRNIPDDELTLRYAKEFPEYLEVDDFKADYDRITRKPVPVVATPKERAGAIESIGRRASGGLQGGLGGPLWKGVELGARLLGADDLAQYSKEVSAEAREYDRQQRLKSANTGVAGFLGDVAGAAPSLLPMLPAIAAAPLVGLAQRTAAGIAFGATGGLSTFSDAEKAYYDKYKSEGMSDSEAESAARKSAAIPSIASGIATGTITRFMPVGGVESVTGLFGKGAAASAAGKAAGAEAGKRAVAAGLTEAGVAASIKAGVARQAGLAEARALVATSIPKAFIKGATNEAIEEGIDQIAQSAIQKLSYDPELTLKQAIDNVINSAMVGGALGGSIQAAVQPSARKGAEAAIRQDKIYNELRVQAEAEAKSDATRREDRLEDEMRREKELKALDRTAAENLEAAHAAQQKQRDAQALADKTLIDTLNEKERVEAEAKLTASQQSAVTAIRDLAGKTVGAKITDVTPEGYGPKEPPAATGATAQKMGGLTHAETVLDSELGTRKIEVKDGDTVVGYIAFGNDLNGYDTINMVWVKPDYRGKGISTELYRKALASAKERGRKGLASVDANLHTPEKTKSTRKNFIVRESTDRADTKRALELSGKAHDSVHFIEGEQASRATPAATGATVAITPVPSKQVTITPAAIAKPEAVVETDPAATGANEIIASSFKLSRGLSNAKTRHNNGQDSYEPVFANPIDLALFIVSKKKRSKSHDKYVAELKEAGLSDEQIVAASTEVSARVKALSLQTKAGDIINPAKLPVPPIFGRIKARSTVQVAPAALPPTPPAATGATGQQGGVVFDQEMFQGRGATPEAVYGPEAVAQGRAVPILGQGSYYAFTNSDAKAFGKVSKSRVQLRNPLVIDSSRKWAELLAAANASHLDSGGQMFYREPQGIAPATLRLKAYVQAQGHDGIVIKDTKLDQNKRLRESFGHDQVVSYASAPPAATGAKIEIRKGEVGGMLSSGEVVLTSSGRKTTPFPQIKTDTNRKATATVKQVDAWLRDNAIAEARSRNDDFNARQFEFENPAKMPQASKDSMEEYLFGHQPVVPKPFLNPVTPPPPAATGPAYISPEELMARQPKAVPSESVARIEAEEKAYQAQADIKAVTDRILVMIGRKVLPKSVKVVYQPESNFAGYYQSGQIVINAARIVNVEGVLVEEAVHAVWADPELQAAWDNVKKTVTIQDIDEQRLRAAADKRYPDNAELREEAAVAKLVRHRTPAIKGFLIAIRRAVAKAFGFHVKLSDIELIQNAAMSKLTADSKAVQISQPAPPAATGATGQTTWKINKTYKGSDGGMYSDYHLGGNPRGGSLTVELNKNGYRIRNIFVGGDNARKGNATRAYEDLNAESLLKTGNPLRSSEIGYGKKSGSTSQSVDATALWDSLVAKGKASKVGDHYEFKPTPAATGATAQKQPWEMTQDEYVQSRWDEVGNEERVSLDDKTIKATESAWKASHQKDVDLFIRNGGTPENRVLASFDPRTVNEWRHYHTHLLEEKMTGPFTPQAIDAPHPMFKSAELRTPEEQRQIAKADYKKPIPPGEWAKIKQSHIAKIRDAYWEKKPVSSAAVDTYGIKLPSGYVREGNRYVFKPTPAEGLADYPDLQAKPSPAETPFPPYAEKLGIKSWQQAKKLGLDTIIADAPGMAREVVRAASNWIYASPERAAEHLAGEIVAKTRLLGGRDTALRSLANDYWQKAKGATEPGQQQRFNATAQALESLRAAKAAPAQPAKPAPPAATGATAQKMPWEMTRDELLGNNVPEGESNNKTTPASQSNRPAIGEWRMDKDTGELEQLQEFNPHKLDLKEEPVPVENIKVYREWAERGLKAPPVTVVDADGGKLQGSGRRRIMAARLAGKTIEGWRYKKVEGTHSAQTHKEAIQQALREGKPVPESVLADYKGEKWADDALAKPTPPPPAETGGAIRYAASERGADSRYLELAKEPEKNRGILQQMVDEAAKAAGYGKRKFHHGTPDGRFSKFEKGRGIHELGIEAYAFSDSEKVANEFRGGLWVTRDATIGRDDWKIGKEDDGGDVVKAYPKHSEVKTVHLNLSNAEVWEMNGGSYNEAFVTEKLKDAKKGGKTAVVFMDMRDGSYSTTGRWPMSNVAFVFDPSQIKSADPITRDSQGNVIPLSERFNTKSSDIRYAAAERGAGSELGALQGGVDGVDYLNWADRFRTNFITKYAPITKMERVLRESAGMGRAEFGMERWFERLAGVAGIAKASIIEMRMELDPLVAGDEKAFNNYIFWQYIERRSTLRAQALADVASARAMVANGTATDADKDSIARNNKLADQMEFAGYDNPTVAKKNLDSIRANLAKSGALEDMDKAVAIYVKHTNLALDNIVDSGYLAQDRIDKYRNQFPVYIPIINLQIPDSKNGYQVTKGRIGISDPNFKSKNPLDAFDEYIFRMHAKAEVNKAKRRIHKLVVTADRPDIARVEYDRLSSTESGFSLRVNGVDTMVVAHPEVVAAVNSFSDTASNTLNDFLRKANSVLKFGATSASLAFQVRNLFMGDLPALALMSKAGITNPINAVTFVIDVITSFAHNFRASAYGEYSPLMLEFMKSGAMGSSMHSSIDSLGRDTQTGASSEGKISQYIIDAFGKMSNTIEQTSKLAGFKRLMDKAGVKTLAELNDPIKQMALVAEVRNYCGSPDFARNGSVMGLAMIRLGFVFVNPAMAGNASALERLTANLNKNSSDSDKKAALTAQIRLGFTVGLATMISYALRSQDDEAEESYDGLDKKSKEDNFHLVTDKYDVDIEGNKVRRFVKIPKRGVIKIVANTMEAYLDYSRAKDPEDFTRMMGRVLEEVIPLDIKGDTLEERLQGTMASVNPAIRVPIEYATGMSFYARQPTVPRSMRGAANSEQYRERTNENIKMLAGVFGVSPLKFKQALDNATGGLTRTLLPEKESELNVDSPINIPLVKGYFSPTYRESEDKEYISELRKEADTATVVRTRAAVAFMKSMEGKTIKETYQTAAAKYARTQPELFDRIDDLIDQKMSGATIEDRHITSLPNAQRAKIVMAKLQKLPVGERREAVKVLYRKKVISDATADEMLKAGYNFRQ